jgi:hypothetical protein
MAKRNQLNRATLSTVPNLTTTTLTATTVSASSTISATTVDGTTHCSTANLLGGGTFTVVTNQNNVIIYSAGEPSTGSIDWTAFKYSQPYTIVNLSAVQVLLSGAVSASTTGLSGLNAYGPGAGLNEYMIPARTFLEGVAYDPGLTVGGNPSNFTYYVYNSGTVTV